MTPNDSVPLRALELRLLRCSVPSDRPSPPPPTQPSPLVSDLHTLLNEVVTLIESGNYHQALSSSSQTLFSDLNLECSDSDSAQRFYSEILPDWVDSFLDSGNVEERDSEETDCRALLLMAVGVAALLAFTQCNITGPAEELPCMPFTQLWIGKNETVSSDLVQWEAWAHTELMSVGSDLRGKFSNLQYLILAKTLLQRTKNMLCEGNVLYLNGVRSITWWLVRVLFLHQRLLDERSSHLFDQLQFFKHEILHCFGTLKKMEDYWGACEDSSSVLSMLQLELGIVELYYGRVDASRLHFESAAEISNYNFFVSGALGFRTLHQVEPKAQLRLVTKTINRDPCAQFNHESSTAEGSALPESHDMSEVSDVLMKPRYVEDEKLSESESSASQLTPIHQAMILAQCFSIEKRARDDELQRWEMAPYIEAVDSQNSSPFILRYFCDLLRVRWESTRSRTKQRALLMMEKLVQDILNTSPGVAQRIYFSYGVNIPTIPALRKEYGDLLVSCGLIGEAVKVYEDLELWDNLIYCYQLMEKKAAAIPLIKTRLTEKPSDPRLWCSLGDITDDDAYYEKALEVSGRRSARAFRSLARSAYNRGDYEKSKVLWESAMALNSMHPDGWFALGAAALKSRDVDKALDAFTRAVQLDPENGEAWNNVACLHMIKKRSKEAFIAFKEALKLKRDSWQMWENYSHVAADIGNFSQAMEAIMKVLDMTKRKRVDCELLERILLEIEGRASSSLFQPHDSIGDSNHDNPNNVDSEMKYAKYSTSSEVDSARTRETEHLIQLIGQILRQIAQSGGSAESWGLYARWHKLKGDLTMCSEALLKQVRSYQGSDLWKDKDRFVKFACASLELCRVYQRLALSNKSRRELYAAEMHLKSTIKQAVNFSDTEEYRALVSCLEQVQESLKALSVPDV